MSSPLYYLSKAQLERIGPYFLLSHGVSRVDDRKVFSGIIYVIKSGLQWKDAPIEYGQHKTLYNRFIRWSHMGIFSRIFMELSRKSGPVEQLMIDATHLKAHGTAANLLKKGLLSRCIGRTKGGLNTKLHAVCDEQGKPIALALTSGQASDYKGAALLLDRLPPSTYLLADQGYDAAWFRNALHHKGIIPCIPSRACRKTPFDYDKILYKQRHQVENMFGRIKDWRRIAMRYDRCTHTFFSAICIACCVIFYLN